MKRKIAISISLFAVAFVVAYFICSFCIPGWKVKLEADATTVFIENLKILWPIKVLISLVAGTIVASIPFWIHKKELQVLIIFFLINIALFYILPSLIMDTGSAIIVLLVILPLSCLFVAVIYGSLNSFHIAYPLLVALAFTPTIWIFFNESAWVYIPAYGGIALIGNLIGASIYKCRNPKLKDNSKK